MSSYPCIDISKPGELNEHDMLLTSFAKEAQAMKKLQEQHSDEAGTLRRVITDLRASLRSVMGGALQINLPGQQMCARLKTYNTAKAIRNDLIDNVLQEILGEITVGCDDWKNQIEHAVTAGVRAKVVTTKQYVDVCPVCPRKAADKTKVVLQASGDDVAVRLAHELQRVQAEFKALQIKYKQLIAAPTQRIEELRKPVLDELSRRGNVDKVRIVTGDKESMFVAGKLSYRSVKLTIGKFQAILRDALNQCEDDCSVHEIRKIVLKRVNHFREEEETKSERDVVRLDRIRSKRV